MTLTLSINLTTTDFSEKMSEKKRFRLGSAVVNLCMMKPDLAETVVTMAEASLKCVNKGNDFCFVKLDMRKNDMYKLNFFIFIFKLLTFRLIV